MRFLAQWVEAERGRFVLWIPVAMIAGIVLYFNLLFEPSPWIGPLAALASAAGLSVAWRQPVCRYLALLLLCAAVGFTRAQLETAGEPPLLKVPYGSVQVEGRVAAFDQMATGRRVTIEPASLDGRPIARSIRVKLRQTDVIALHAGEVVALRALLFKPERPAYPGGWDSGRDAFFSGLGASGFALGDVTITAASKGAAMSLWLRRRREAIAERIMAALPPDTGAVAVTLLTGFEQQLPAQERQDFITAGLAHLLAVAGLHVGIVMGLFFALTRYVLSRHEFTALRLPGKAIASIIAWLAGVAYAALTGAHLPILRSLAMASMVTLAILSGRRAVSLRGLALAAVYIMLITPDAVVGVSFQMSFSAVLALIAGYAALKDLNLQRLNHGHTHRAGGHLLSVFISSLLAGGASMPFSAFQFQQVQPYWILANLVAVPLTAMWVLPLGLVALALMPLHADTLALIPMGWGLWIVVKLTRVVAGWPGAMLTIPPISGGPVLCLAFGLAWLCLWRSQGRYFGILFVLIGLLAALDSRSPDVLVSPDAKLIAVSAPPSLVLLRQPKASAYTLAQWRPVWAGKAFSPLDPSQCDDMICRPSTRFNNIVIVLNPPATCPPAALIVSPEPLYGLCRNNGVVIDRFTVWREGAVAVWLARGGIHVLTDRQVQGERPWVPAWPSSRRERSQTKTTLD